MGQPETRLALEPRSAFDSIADASGHQFVGTICLLIANTSRSIQPSSFMLELRQQRQKIIRNGVALVGKESVSGSPAATAAG